MLDPKEASNAADNNNPAAQRLAEAAADIVNGDPPVDRNLPPLCREGKTASIAFDVDAIKAAIAHGDRGYAIDLLLNAACSTEVSLRDHAMTILKQVLANPCTDDPTKDRQVKDMIASSARVMSRLLLSGKVNAHWALPVDVARLAVSYKPTTEPEFVYQEKENGKVMLRRVAESREEVDKRIQAHIDGKKPADQPRLVSANKKPVGAGQNQDLEVSPDVELPDEDPPPQRRPASSVEEIE
jgi:hypothetical protein